MYIVVIATRFLTNFYPFYHDFVNKEVFYSVNGLWKVNRNISCNQFYILGYFQLFTNMFKLLVILFIIKMYACNNIFKRIKRNHRQDMITLARLYEQLKTKYMKATADILFIKTCKIENSIQTSAKVKLSVKDDNKNLTRRITRTVMES